MTLFSGLLARSLFSVGAMGGFLATMVVSAIAAEKIQFFVGPFEPTIYIEDLETFAADGTVPERLGLLARRFDETQLDSIRTLLNTSYPTDLIAVSQFTYGRFGEHLLYQAGQIVQTDSFRNGGFALRSSLLLAAANEPDCCTMLDLMRHYPLETIQINLALALQVVDENNRVFQVRDEVIAGVREIAVEQVQADGWVVLPDYEPHAVGAYTWQKETIAFQNPLRSQASLADLYLPDSSTAAPGEIPLVIISHGIASDRTTFAYLAEHIASHGYGVVTLEHAETSAEKFTRFLQGLEGPPSPESLLARPRDITAVLDTLEQRAIAEPVLQAVNLQSVGVLGQSLGGYTALAAGGAQLDPMELEEQCLAKVEERPSVNLSLLVQCRIMELPDEFALDDVQDTRVQAVVAVNPVTSSVFGEAGLSQLQVPLLMISASDDYFAPMVDEQIMPFTWFTHDESYLVVMEHGTHFSFLNSPEEGAFALPTSFIGPTPELARPHLKGLSVAFFNRYLRDRTADEAFLTQAYLAEMPQEPFRFDIIHNFFE